MDCRYDKNKSWLEIVIMPTVIAIIGVMGTCSANRISKDHNKAAILKEFLPILLNGSTGEREIAKVALEPYLSESEWKRINWGTQQKIQWDLIKAIEAKNTQASDNAITSLQKLYPDSFNRLLKGETRKEDPPAQKLLDTKLKTDTSYKTFFYNAVRQPAILDSQEQ